MKTFLLDIQNDTPCPSTMTTPSALFRVPPFKMRIEGSRSDVIRDLYLPIMVQERKCILCFGGNQYIAEYMIPVIKEGITEHSLYELYAHVRLMPNNTSHFYAANEFFLESIEVHISASNVTALIHLNRDMIQKPWIRANMNFQTIKEDYLASLRPLSILFNHTFGKHLVTEKMPTARGDIVPSTIAWLNQLRGTIIQNNVKVSLIKHIIVRSQDEQLGLKLHLSENKIADYCMILPANAPPVRKEMMTATVKGVFCFNQFGTGSLQVMVQHMLAHSPKPKAPLHVKASLLFVHVDNIIPLTRMIPDTTTIVVLPTNGSFLSLEKIVAADCIVASGVICPTMKPGRRQDLVDANLPILTSVDAPHDIFGPQSISLHMDDPRLRDPMFKARIYGTKDHFLKLITFGGGLYVHDHVDLSMWFTRYLRIKVEYRMAFFPNCTSMTIIKAARWILDDKIAPLSVITPCNFIAQYSIKVLDPFRSHVTHHPVYIRPGMTELPISSFSLQRTYMGSRSDSVLTHVPKLKPAAMLQNWGRFVRPVQKFLEGQIDKSKERHSQEESLLSETQDPEMEAFIRTEMTRCLDDIHQADHMIAHIQNAKGFVEEQCDKLERLDADMTCAICLSRVKDPIMNAACGHAQCATCMGTVMKTMNHVCPQCRVPICDSLIKLVVPNIAPDRYCVESYGSKMIQMIKFVEASNGVSFVMVRDVAARTEVVKALTAHEIPTGITLSGERYPEGMKALVLTFDDCAVDVDLSHLGGQVIIMEAFSSKAQYIQLIAPMVGKCLGNPKVRVLHLLMTGSEDEVMFQAYCKSGQKRKRE